MAQRLQGTGRGRDHCASGRQDIRSFVTAQGYLVSVSKRTLARKRRRENEL